MSLFGFFTLGFGEATPDVATSVTLLSTITAEMMIKDRFQRENISKTKHN